MSVYDKVQDTELTTCAWRVASSSLAVTTGLTLIGNKHFPCYRLLAHSHHASHEAQQVLVRLHHALEGRGGAGLLALVRVQRDRHLSIASPQRCGACAGRQPQHLGSNASCNLQDSAMKVCRSAALRLAVCLEASTHICACRTCCWQTPYAGKQILIILALKISLWTASFKVQRQGTS